MKKLLRPDDPRDIIAAKWEIEYEDIYHFKNLYKLAHEFLVEKGWVDPVDNDENWERLYYESVLPDGAKEFRIWWRMIHVPYNNPYIRYVLKVDFLGLRMEKTEIVHEGVKYKTWKGDLIIYCEAWLQMDYNDKWKKSKLLSTFEKFFRERIFKPYYEAHKRELHRRAYQFNRELKRYLGLKTPIDEAKQFRELKGTPA